MQTWSLSLQKAASARRKQASHKGFTLAEILVAIAIAAFILTGATGMFIQFYKTNLTMAARSDFDRQMRMTIQELSDDARMAANASISSGSCTLTMPNGNTPQLIHYIYRGDNIYRQEDSGDERLLLENVSKFTASQSNDSLSFSVTLSKDIGDRNITLDRDLNIRMRN
ncbi:MAG: prepilin-type N-terminal cleavage/methylation domain-containing protein [Verrucomicrobiota bacterium]